MYKYHEYPGNLPNSLIHHLFFENELQQINEYSLYV